MTKIRRSKASPSRTLRRPSALDGGALGEGLEFMRVLWELDHELRRASKSMDTRLGVTGPQRLIIRLVGRFPGLAAGELAALLHVHPSSLTAVLARLGRRRLILRRADPEDGRRALLSLTLQGRAVDRVRSGTVEAAVARALGTQPGPRIAGAREVLASLVRELGASSPSTAETRRTRRG